MNRIAAFVLAAAFSSVTLLSSASAEDVQDQLKKLETDRAATVVKGDVATLEKQTSDDYTLINMNGQMSDKSQMVNAFKSGRTKLTSDELSDLTACVYGNTAVVTGKADVKGRSVKAGVWNLLECDSVIANNAKVRAVSQ